ncbi:hypothetical protein BCO9919_04144 [Burkholderia cenocepacia]|uniref:Uncharacterized protein n=1 Tax=Burkholderia cenocepacia TaxID=95486 RepID=A0A6J5JEX2_9BURK|nr:hypothetical protein BCO9919_04144 [Burkholderia cenocepacia]
MGDARHRDCLSSPPGEPWRRGAAGRGRAWPAPLARLPSVPRVRGRPPGPGCPAGRPPPVFRQSNETDRRVRARPAARGRSMRTGRHRSPSRANHSNRDRRDRPCMSGRPPHSRQPAARVSGCSGSARSMREAAGTPRCEARARCATTTCERRAEHAWHPVRGGSNRTASSAVRRRGNVRAHGRPRSRIPCSGSWRCAALRLARSGSRASHRVREWCDWGGLASLEAGGCRQRGECSPVVMIRSSTAADRPVPECRGAYLVDCRSHAVFMGFSVTSGARNTFVRDGLPLHFWSPARETQGTNRLS